MYFDKTSPNPQRYDDFLTYYSMTAGYRECKFEEEVHRMIYGRSDDEYDLKTFVFQSYICKGKKKVLTKTFP